MPGIIMAAYARKTGGKLVFVTDGRKFYVLDGYTNPTAKGANIDLQEAADKVVCKTGNPMRALAAYNDRLEIENQRTVGDWAERHGYNRYTGERISVPEEAKQEGAENKWNCLR